MPSQLIDPADLPTYTFDWGVIKPLVSDHNVSDPGVSLMHVENISYFCDDCDESHDTALYLALTDLTDADITCHEGRQIVFVDPRTSTPCRGVGTSCTGFRASSATRRTSIASGGRNRTGSAA